MNQTSNNKRIAKNTMMLYIRMLLSMVVSLYTSRVVLEVLGVEDYGIYGVVGGVVAMFSFLNSSMAGATSRFLTFEMGKGDAQRLRDTFSSALIIHFGIALVVFILAETVGLWFLNNKLVIPESRMGAAHWVYQCSIISTMLAITQVPYNATIIAHEKMDVYAYIEILNVTLKLLIVYLLTIGNLDKLKMYAVLVLSVSVIVMMAYRIYCMRKFQESHFRFVWKKDFLRPILSFTGWDFYGNMCFTARAQGTTFLINTFWGVVANAASSVATTVNGIIQGFAGNIITAFRPRIIKNYSQQNWDEMQSLMSNAIKFSTLFLVMLSIPFLFETSYIIALWLGQVPQYVEPFIRLILITNYFSVINSVIVIGIHATGNIKRISFYTGSVILLAIPVSYVFLKLGFDVETVYVVNLVSNIFVVSLNLSILKKQVCNIQILPILMVIAIVFLVTILVFALSYLLFALMPSGIYRLIAITLCDVMTMALLTYFVALDRSQRCFVKRFLVGKLILRSCE